MVDKNVFINGFNILNSLTLFGIRYKCNLILKL